MDGGGAEAMDVDPQAQPLPKPFSFKVRFAASPAEPPPPPLPAVEAPPPPPAAEAAAAGAAAPAELTAEEVAARAERKRRKREKKAARAAATAAAAAAAEGGEAGAEPPSKKRKLEEGVEGVAGAQPLHAPLKLKLVARPPPAPAPPTYATNGGRPTAVNLATTLERISRLDADHFFQQPVSDDYAPGYSAVVAAPMDFATMRRKQRRGAYGSWESLLGDVQLIVSNCLLYNGEESVYSEAAKRLGAQAFEIIASKRCVQKTSSRLPLSCPPHAPSAAPSCAACRAARRAPPGPSQRLPPSRAAPPPPPPPPGPQPPPQALPPPPAAARAACARARGAGGRAPHRPGALPERRQRRGPKGPAQRGQPLGAVRAA